MLIIKFDLIVKMGFSFVLFCYIICTICTMKLHFNLKKWGGGGKSGVNDIDKNKTIQLAEVFKALGNPLRLCLLMEDYRQSKD